MRIPGLLFIVSLVTFLLGTEARAVAPIVYTKAEVTQVAQDLLPAKFRGVAVDSRDALLRKRIYLAYPDKKSELDFLYKQSAGAFHARASNSDAKHICYVFYTARNNDAHSRIKAQSGLDDGKVMRLVIAHEVNHCIVHDIMSRSLDSLRTSGHAHHMAWFPITLHDQLRSAVSGSSKLSQLDLARSKLQRWTESLTDMFAVSALWQEGSLTSPDVKAYLAFRTAEAPRDPEHATAGGLRKLYAMLLALEQHPVAAKAYRSMPIAEQQKVLLDMLTEEAATW